VKKVRQSYRGYDLVVVDVALFTRDLRVHDQPALATAAAADAVVPLFVVDDGIRRTGFGCPNRGRFLAESLHDLDEALRRRGAGLVVRRGDVVDQVVRVAREVNAERVHLSGDVSGYAQRRQRRLAEALADERRGLRVHRGGTVVPPGSATPRDKDHAMVFTPYFRKWLSEPKPSPVAPPEALRLPGGLGRGRLPGAGELGGKHISPAVVSGGEGEGRRRLEDWLGGVVAGYADGQDDLAADATSRLSPYLHFGCVSPAEIIARADRRLSGVDPFVRQLAWRDFHHQVLAARPEAAREDYRTRGDRWVRDDDALAAWREGRTGYPIVDAGMRQLAAEGWMHNRARLLTASFLTKDLYVDWRLGARHFLDLLVDGDVANNQLNWQWVAGTGTDTRPNRVFNPTRQAHRYDPNGDYVRRHVPELACVDGPAVHEPWRWDGALRRRVDYPPPLCDHEQAVRCFRAYRGKA
jgi:deoxyribodipyrimidine photo-lyase